MSVTQNPPLPPPISDADTPTLIFRMDCSKQPHLPLHGFANQVMAGFIVLVGLTLSLGQSSSAGIAEVYEAYTRQDYATALKELLPLVENGDARAQVMVGELYRDGQGTPQDYDEAVRWYRRAVNQGLDAAQESLAVLYMKGHGVPKDYVEARKLLLAAADQGLASAQFRLGVMYQRGWGVTQDDVEAHKWLNIAGANGHAESSKFRDYIAKSMTSAQIAEAQRLAREWMAAHQ